MSGWSRNDVSDDEPTEAERLNASSQLKAAHQPPPCSSTTRLSDGNCFVFFLGPEIH